MLETQPSLSGGSEVRVPALETQDWWFESKSQCWKNRNKVGVVSLVACATLPTKDYCSNPDVVEEGRKTKLKCPEENTGVVEEGRKTKLKCPEENTGVVEEGRKTKLNAPRRTLT